MPDPIVISVQQLNLNSYKVYDADTAAEVMRTAQANVYTVSNVTEADGITPRKLSIAELVMVVCLARAADKEAAVIALMREMSDTTATLEGLTDVETKLLDGQSLNSIRGVYYYGGYMFTNARDFLVYALGYRDVPDLAQYIARQIENLTEIQEQLAAGANVVTMSGSWELANGSTLNTLHYLESMGVLDDDQFDFYQTLRNIYIRPGNIVSDAALQNLRDRYGFDMPSGTTVTELLAEANRVYGPGLISSVNAKITELQAGGSLTPLGPTAPDGILPTGDQLITEIESKMDSLNSFSQQKMIELQSETNKRDQAYDMITNILKSLNTVQVGIANNI